MISGMNPSFALGRGEQVSTRTEAAVTHYVADRKRRIEFAGA
jgi:hypothetical protein